MTVLFSIAVALIAGLLMTRAINFLKLPDVTAYLIAGILIGPSCLGALGVPGLGFTTYDEIGSLSMISNLALGFIAFAIGNEFMLPKLRNTGRQAVVVAICEGLAAVVFVEAAMIALHFIMPDKLSLPAAVTLGAIASATAPAATLMVVRQYKAKGPVTDILLPVVALDDAVGLVCFAVAFGIARALLMGAVDLISIIVEPLIEIVFSLVLGAVMGYILNFIEKFFHSNRNRMTLIIGFVIATVALSMLEFEIGGVTVGFSTLLVCMMLGTVFCNTCPLADELMEKSDRWTAPLFTLFFVLSGAELRLNIFTDIFMVGIGIVYIVFRCIGKYTGAGMASRLMGCDKNVTKWLGVTLFPQAGVALGMSLTAATYLGKDGLLVRNIILFGVLIYELFGPMLTKIALTKAGDIRPMDEATKNRRQIKLSQKAL